MSVKKAYLATVILVAALTTYTLLYLRGIDFFWLFALIVTIVGGYIGAVVAAKRAGFEGFGSGQKSGQGDTGKK